MALSELTMEVLGVRSMAIECEVVKEEDSCQLYSDASAALSIARRQGAWKMRHIHVRSIWLQEKSLQKILQYRKIKGEHIPADWFTKHVRLALARKYAATTFTELSSDRALSGLKLAL